MKINAASWLRWRPPCRCSNSQRLGRVGRRVWCRKRSRRVITTSSAHALTCVKTRVQISGHSCTPLWNIRSLEKNTCSIIIMASCSCSSPRGLARNCVNPLCSMIKQNAYLGIEWLILLVLKHIWIIQECEVWFHLSIDTFLPFFKAS